MSIWTGVKTSSSIRKLFRDITSATGASPDCLLLRPSPVAQPILWAGPNQEPATPRSPSMVLKALGQVPAGSRVAGPQAPWVQSLVAAVFGTGPSVVERQVMAISSGSADHRLPGLVPTVARILSQSLDGESPRRATHRPRRHQPGNDPNAKRGFALGAAS